MNTLHLNTIVKTVESGEIIESNVVDPKAVVELMNMNPNLFFEPLQLIRRKQAQSYQYWYIDSIEEDPDGSVDKIIYLRFENDQGDAITEKIKLSKIIDIIRGEALPFEFSMIKLYNDDVIKLELLQHFSKLKDKFETQFVPILDFQ